MQITAERTILKIINSHLVKICCIRFIKQTGAFWAPRFHKSAFIYVSLFRTEILLKKEKKNWSAIFIDDGSLWHRWSQRYKEVKEFIVAQHWVGVWAHVILGRVIENIIEEFVCTQITRNSWNFNRKGCKFIANIGPCRPELKMQFYFNENYACCLFLDLIKLNRRSLRIEI